MNVRLLRGTFKHQDTYAIDNFEELSIGAIVEFPVGVEENGNVHFETGIFNERL